MIRHSAAWGLAFRAGSNITGCDEITFEDNALGDLSLDCPAQ